MALSLITRKSTRTSFTGRTPLERNDLEVSVKKTKTGDRDTIRISDEAFKNLGLLNKGVSFLFDDEVNKNYLAVVDEDSAQVLKGRTKPDGTSFDKGTEFQHLQLLESLEQVSFIPKDRTVGFKAGFKLVLTDIQFEGADAIYEIQPDELKVNKPAATVVEGEPTAEDIQSASSVEVEEEEEEWPSEN